MASGPRPPCRCHRLPGKARILLGNSTGSAAQGTCVAVGFYTDQKTNRDQALIDTLSGGTWTVAKALLPPGSETDSPAVSYVGVACPSSDRCVAVGSVGSSGQAGQDFPFIETGSPAVSRPRASGTGWREASQSVQISV
jgi:hypothetical protein